MQAGPCKKHSFSAVTELSTCYSLEEHLPGAAPEAFSSTGLESIRIVFPRLFRTRLFIGAQGSAFHSPVAVSLCEDHWLRLLEVAVATNAYLRVGG